MEEVSKPRECPYVSKSVTRGGYGVIVLKCSLTGNFCVTPDDYENCLYYERKKKDEADEYKDKRE